MSEGDTRQAALVTGGARRIGRAVALHLASEGWDIGVHYNNSEPEAVSLAVELEEAGATCKLYRKDLTEVDDIEGLAEQFTSDFPAATTLINSASIYAHDTLATLSVDNWNAHLTVNALAPILLSREFAARIAKQGCIINFLDQKVINVTPDFFSYTVSKGALCDATQMLAMALGPRTRVNAIAPGLVLQSGEQTANEFQRAHSDTPLGIGPTLDEICQAISFIASSPSMTAQVITIDGGRHLLREPPFNDLPKTSI